MAVAPNSGVMAGTVGFHRSSPARNPSSSTAAATTSSSTGVMGSPTRPSTKLPVNSVVETKILNALPMPSELFYVIGENAPMLAMSRPQRRHLDGKKAGTGVKWQWKPFENPARDDGLQLSHWERVSPSKEAAGDQSTALDTASGAGAGEGSVSQDYSFARYNTTTNVYSYSSDEYVSHLRDESGNWSREETDYLFGLCHKYDLRWFVIKDRWDFDNLIKEGEEHTTSAEETKSIPLEVPPVNGTPAPNLPNGDTSPAPAKTEEQVSGTPVEGTDVEVKTSNSETVLASTAPAGPFAAPATATTSEVVQPEAQEKKERTIEEMKDRYYSVCRRLIRARPASDENAKQALLQSYAFDKDREAARKHHIQNVLMKRTLQQLEEEEFLYVESRRLEQQYNKISREREELWRTLCGVGPQSTSALALNSPFLSAAARENAANAAGLSNKKRRRGELDMLEDPNNTGTKVADTSALPQLTPAQDEQYGITRFDASTPASSVIRPSGVYLRSAKPPQLKTSLAPKITAALQEQNISMRLTMPTRQNMEKLEALVSAITSLLDCKKQVERAEYEVKVLKTRKDAAMRIDEEDRAIKAQEDEEARKQKEKEASNVPSGDGLTPQGETSSATSSMQVDT